MFFEVVVFIIFAAAFIYLFSIEKYKRHNINQWSYQRYAKFFGMDTFTENDFDKKIKKIEKLINLDNEKDLKVIAKKSNCYYEETILKIRYLMNKRRIKKMYIDTKNKCLVPCDAEDMKLINKYAPYIYRNHLQIPEIAVRMPGSSAAKLPEIKEKIFEDLVYLDDKKLLNGIILDRVDRSLTYYSVEKHAKTKYFVSMNCRNCGGLNDVPRGGKARCEYCDTIIENKDGRLSN